MKQDQFLCINDDDWRRCAWCRSVDPPALLRTTNRFLGCQIILEVDRATNGYVYAWASDDRGVRDGRHWLHCFMHHSRSLAARLQSANDCSRPRWNKILHSLTPLPNLIKEERKKGRKMTPMLQLAWLMVLFNLHLIPDFGFELWVYHKW